MVGQTYRGMERLRLLAEVGRLLPSVTVQSDAGDAVQCGMNCGFRFNDPRRGPMFSLLRKNWHRLFSPSWSSVGAFKTTMSCFSRTTPRFSQSCSEVRLEIRV